MPSFRWKDLGKSESVWIVALLTGIQGIPVDRGLLALSALIFIGLTLVLGIVSKRLLISAKSKE